MNSVIHTLNNRSVPFKTNPRFEHGTKSLKPAEKEVIESTPSWTSDTVRRSKQFRWGLPLSELRTLGLYEILPIL